MIEVLAVVILYAMFYPLIAPLADSIWELLLYLVLPVAVVSLAVMYMFVPESKQYIKMAGGATVLVAVAVVVYVYVMHEFVPAFKAGYNDEPNKKGN